MEKNLYQFFAAYEKRFNDALNGEADVERMAEGFAPFFVEASPVGITGGFNDHEFRKKIPLGIEFYQQIGTRSIEMVSQDVTTLDAMHYMVKIHWKATYKSKDNSDLAIEFNVIYFLQEKEGTFKIFAYISGDEQGVLRQHGLIQ